MSPHKRSDRSSPPLAWPLGDMTAQRFLRDHWQKRPLVIRGALPQYSNAPVDARALCALAGEDGVESRLVTAFRGQWRLQHGPFMPEDLPALSRKRWTLLVQGVDLHRDSAHQLLGLFRFLPDARVDDLMISLASDQGGVGPHVDAYDVFLLQTWGCRRWRIAPPGDGRLKPGLPLKILESFEPNEEYLLEPGDMLYLPPGWGHDGVAEGACMTASIGFRAPSRSEFLREFLTACADDLDLSDDPRFTDPGRRAAQGQAAAIPGDLHRTLTGWARGWRPDAEAIDRFIGRYLTEPKPSVWFESSTPPGATAMTRAAAKRGLKLDRRTRMLYRNGTIFVNGEDFDFDAQTLEAMQRFANLRQLDPSLAARFCQDATFVDIVRAWIGHGWVEVG